MSKSIVLQTDVTLEDGSRYQLHRIKAAEGTYISNLLLTKMVPGMVAPLLGLTTPGASSGTMMSPDEWMYIQRSMLRSISKYNGESGMALPLVNAAGMLTEPSLEYDTATLMELVTRAIGFNFTDFFGKSGMSLARMLEYITGQPLKTSPTSITTSGDQSSPDSGLTPTS
jgi:hypothetical protein